MLTQARSNNLVLCKFCLSSYVTDELMDSAEGEIEAMRLSQAEKRLFAAKGIFFRFFLFLSITGEKRDYFLFSCGHSTLSEALSVRLSVYWSVRLLVYWSVPKREWKSGKTSVLDACGVWLKKAWGVDAPAQWYCDPASLVFIQERGMPLTHLRNID